MKPSFEIVPGSVTAPQGFLASGVFCDIKRLGTGKGSNKGPKRDLALIVSEVPAVAAGLFTTNQICAAPVKLCVRHLRRGQAQAIVANSGNANACTGAQGMRDAERMVACASAQLLLPRGQVLVASTGRIGVRLPIARVETGIRQAAALLGSEPVHADEAAEAIMTSDTKPKAIAVETLLGGRKVRLGGICKGAGMIQPGMSPTGRRPAVAPRARHATMLCFLTTDAAIDRGALQLCLEEAVARSFNRITVDGDMSTNDSVIALANGLAENPKLSAAELAGKGGVKDSAQFQAALNHVCLALAQMIVRDGEGVSRFVTVRIEGARSGAEAEAAARAVANSSLVKTSWCGGDPNWGRIMGALGYSTARVVEERVDIAYSVPGSGRWVYSLRRGQPTHVAFGTLCALVAKPEFDLRIDLNLGRGRATIYASDLTEAYVDFNKGDVSDPASLGG
jgi:glutamate N-acetyltransferase/amino-acid N-acetyltransferase